MIRKVKRQRFSNPPANSTQNRRIDSDARRTLRVGVFALMSHHVHGGGGANCLGRPQNSQLYRLVTVSGRRAMIALRCQSGSKAIDSAQDIVSRLQSLSVSIHLHR